MLRSLRWAMAAGLVSGLTLLPVHPSAGEVAGANDPAGDVAVIWIDAGPNLEHYARLRPERAHGDIRSLRANHARTRVITRLRFRNINAAQGLSHDFAFRTRRSHFNVFFAHTGARIEEKELYNESRERYVRCPGLTLKVNVSKDQVRVLVPRGCIGRPAWVRVGADTWSYSWSTDEEYYDDAMRRGRNSDDWGFTGPTLGPRLLRGA